MKEMGEKSLAEKQQKEAVRRMRKIVALFNLEVEYVNAVKQGKYDYTYDDTFSETAMDICFSKVKEFKKKYSAYIYYVILSDTPGLGPVLNILYVGANTEDWSATDVYDEWVYAATYTVNDDFWEFGSIKLENRGGLLVRAG